MKKHLLSALFIAALLTLAVAVQAVCDQSAGWCPPTDLPPNPAGTAMPLNTGSVGQTKTGSLTVEPGNLTVGPTGNLFVSGAGLFSNGLGMISTFPGSNFVLKNFDSTNNPAGLLNPVWGKVLMATDTFGTATWAATSTLGLGGGVVGIGAAGQIPYYAANGATLTATSSLFLNTNGGVKVSNLAGSGNAYVCVDSTGQLYRSPAACL